MTQADKVIAFLDLSDAWDPSLAFVMIGAIGVHMALFRFIVRRPSPLFADAFGIPTRSDIDGRLVAGSALFGVGWALGGYCPGPGLVSSASGSTNALVFVATLTAGMLLYHALDEAWHGYWTTRVAKAEPEKVELEPVKWDQTEMTVSK
ncbi:MAG: YeeE/YedE family protein [Alphaproteobacteria bacterium]|nr:YeeE/YedE family protein [Alphaproteobacteria bacterium]